MTDAIQCYDGDGVMPQQRPSPVAPPRACVNCGRDTPYAEATLIDPFELKVNHFRMPTWLCYACAGERLRDA